MKTDQIYQNIRDKTMLNFHRLLNLPGIKILKVDESQPRKILFYVETTEKFTLCHVCAKKINKKHGKDKEREVKHLPMIENDVFIIYQPNRYICDDCDNHPTTTATPSWHTKHSAYTNAYERHIIIDLVNSTLVDVAVKASLTTESVLGILNRLVKKEIDWSTIKYIGALAIDEIALKKGYKNYVTMMSCRVDGVIRILAVLKGRKKSTIKAFLKSIPKKLKKTVEAICVDMYDGYINAAKEVFKNSALIVIDRFHVAKRYRGALDKYRQKILKELKQTLSDVEYTKITGATKIVRKTNECLTKEEKAIVSELFSWSPSLMEAYRLAIKLTHIFNTQQSKNEALTKFKEWMSLVRKSKLTFFNKFIKTLRKLKNEVGNYFIDRNTSGFAEGLNNKMKVLKRRCYGIFDLGSLFQRAHLDVSGYRLYATNKGLL